VCSNRRRHLHAAGKPAPLPSVVTSSSPVHYADNTTMQYIWFEASVSHCALRIVLQDLPVEAARRPHSSPFCFTTSLPPPRTVTHSATFPAERVFMVTTNIHVARRVPARHSQPRLLTPPSANLLAVATTKVHAQRNSIVDKLSPLHVLWRHVSLYPIHHGL
jgi:hypothetical protein